LALRLGGVALRRRRPRSRAVPLAIRLFPSLLGFLARLLPSFFLLLFLFFLLFLLPLLLRLGPPFLRLPQLLLLLLLPRGHHPVLGALHSLLGVPLILEQVALDLGRRELVGRDFGCELLRQLVHPFDRRLLLACQIGRRRISLLLLLRCEKWGLGFCAPFEPPEAGRDGASSRRNGAGRRHLVGVERGVDGTENLSRHRLVGTVELNDHVDAPGADQSLVKLLDVVGRHDQHAPFLRGHAIEDVEKAREGEAALGVLVGGLGGP